MTRVLLLGLLAAASGFLPPTRRATPTRSVSMGAKKKALVSPDGGVVAAPAIEEAEAGVAASFEEVATEGEWVALDEAEVRSWLLRSDLRMKSEKAAFDALVRWTEHRPAEREGSFEDMTTKSHSSFLWPPQWSPVFFWSQRSPST